MKVDSTFLLLTLKINVFYKTMVYFNLQKNHIFALFDAGLFILLFNLPLLA